MQCNRMLQCNITNFIFKSGDFPPKANPGVHIIGGGGVTSGKMVHLRQVVKYWDEGCMALGCKWPSVINNLLWGTRQHLIVSELSTHMGNCNQWLLRYPLPIGPKMDSNGKILVLKTLKTSDWLPCREIPITRNSSAGGWDLWCTIIGYWHNQWTCSWGFSQGQGWCSKWETCWQ
jgi:hypothetical protein